MCTVAYVNLKCYSSENKCPVVSARCTPAALHMETQEPAAAVSQTHNFI